MNDKHANLTDAAGGAFYSAGGTDVAAADGGTGRSSHTAYAVLCGGTTSTAAQQSIASVGTAGQVLTSNGAGALPTFQAVALSAKTWQEIEAITPAAASSVTSGAAMGVDKRYRIDFRLTQNTSAGIIQFRFNADSGNNYATTAFYYNGLAAAAWAVAAQNCLFATYAAVTKVTYPAWGYIEFSTDPADGTRVICQGEISHWQNNNNIISTQRFIGWYDGASSLSSVTIMTSAGTFTGTISISEWK